MVVAALLTESNEVSQVVKNYISGVSRPELVGSMVRALAAAVAVKSQQM